MKCTKSVFNVELPEVALMRFLRRAQIGKLPAGLAALWSVIFSLLHFAWAAGWYIGLNAEQAQRAFRQKWFLIYDIAAGILCLLGAVVAGMIAGNRQRGRAHKIIILLALTGTGLLILRGAAGIIKIVYLIISGKSVEWSALWDVWFCLGALWFSLAVRQFLKKS